jgi:hypothetical protein
MPKRRFFDALSEKSSLREPLTQVQGLATDGEGSHQQLISPALFLPVGDILSFAPEVNGHAGVGFLVQLQTFPFHFSNFLVENLIRSSTVLTMSSIQEQVLEKLSKTFPKSLLELEKTFGKSCGSLGSLGSVLELFIRQCRM